MRHNGEDQAVSDIAAKAYAVVGLGWGDEGKGATVDALVRGHEASVVVRFNGGPQAAHRVVGPEGEHIFHQLGSGSLVDGVKTFYSRFAHFSPTHLVSELADLESAIGRHRGVDFYVDPAAPLVTPYARGMNVLAEVLRNASPDSSIRHGSCAFGIHQTEKFVRENLHIYPRVDDLADRQKLIQNLASQQEELTKGIKLTGEMYTKAVVACEWLQKDPEEVANLLIEAMASSGATIAPAQLILTKDQTVVFEGAQGILLDEDYGTFPWCTHSYCGFQNAEYLATRAGYPLHKIGVIRAFHTRHGAGPFPSYDEELTNWAGSQEEGNSFNESQGSFRTGWFDMPLFRYAVNAANPHSIALRHIDQYRDWKSEHGIPQMVMSHFCEGLGNVADYPVQAPNLSSLRTWSERLGNSTTNLVPFSNPFERINEVCRISMVTEGPSAADTMYVKSL